MSKMTVSVVIAAYKGEKYIGEQLKSLFAQTMLPDEILIGDDSPDDLTGEAVKKACADAPEHIRIDYYKNTPSLGVLMNFSALAERASGDYIFFCDQDDVWLENKIELLVDTLERNPDCCLAACDSMRVTADLQPLERLYNPKFVTGSRHWLFRCIWSMNFSLVGHNIVIRNPHNDGCLPYPSDFNAFHDLWMCIFYGLQNKVIYLDKALTLYRIHESNVSTPYKQGYGKSLLSRLQEQHKSPCHDLEITYANFVKYRDFFLSRVPEAQIPRENLVYLNGSINYYRWRLENYKQRSHCRRIWNMLRYLPDYFKYANGFRSIIRDCLF